jgi:hypothetical protein
MTPVVLRNAAGKAASTAAQGRPRSIGNLALAHSAEPDPESFTKF